MNKLIARAKSVIKITGKYGESCDITIPKDGCVLEALNLYLPVIGISKEVSFSAPQSEWISVEAPSMADGFYLVFANDIVNSWVELLGFKEGQWIDMQNNIFPAIITHWMPLPNPPKGA